MNIHPNARLTPLRREELARIVINGQATQKDASALYGVSVRTVAMGQALQASRPGSHARPFLKTPSQPLGYSKAA